MSDNMDEPPNGGTFAYDADYFAPHDPVRGWLTVLSFHRHTCAVVGLPYENRDGSKRQDVAKRLKERQTLVLVREPHNPYDANAIAVYEAHWTRFPAHELRASSQVGYLPKGLAEMYAPIMDEGAQLFAVLEEKVMRKDGKIDRKSVV